VRHSAGLDKVVKRKIPSSSLYRLSYHKEKQKNMKEMSENVTESHTGINRTYHQTRQDVTWEIMKNDTEDDIRK
jgi:hypothetical protein